MSTKPLIVDWKGLKRMGWCYSRAHTWRLMFDPDYAADSFPKCRKLGKHRSSHPVWRVQEWTCHRYPRPASVPGDVMHLVSAASPPASRVRLDSRGGARRICGRTFAVMGSTVSRSTTEAQPSWPKIHHRLTRHPGRDNPTSVWSPAYVAHWARLR